MLRGLGGDAGRRFAVSAEGDYPSSKEKRAAGGERPRGRFRSVDSYLGRKQMQPTQEDIYQLLQSAEASTVGKTLSPYRPLPAIGDRVPTPMPPPAGSPAGSGRGRVGRGAPPVLGGGRFRPAPLRPPAGPPSPPASAPPSPQPAFAPDSSRSTPRLLRERTYNVLQPRVLRGTSSEREDSASSSSSAGPAAAAASQAHKPAAAAGAGPAAAAAPRRKKRSRRRAAPPPKRAPDGLSNTRLFGPRVDLRRLETHDEVEDASSTELAPHAPAPGTTTISGSFSSELTAERRGEAVTMKWFD